MLAQMALFVVRDSILPKPPGNLEPAIGQTSIGMAERVAVRSNGLEIGIGPDGGIDRALRPLLNDGAELMITGATEEHNLVHQERGADCGDHRVVGQLPVRQHLRHSAVPHAGGDQKDQRSRE